MRTCGISVIIFLRIKANQSSLRQSHQKISAYNLGVAQGVREVKNTRNTDFVVS